MRRETSSRMQSAAHRASCDSSCPNCLRSYDNRWLHPLLDWRLALDVLELVVEGTLDEARWLGDAERLVGSFVAGNLQFGQVEAFERAGLHGVFEPRGRRAVVFGHPLWRVSPDGYGPQLAEAVAEVEADFRASAVQAFDLFTLTRNPGAPLSWLTGGAG
jgi:DEAD/DEAH box helicase domain-containing protein